MHTITCHISPSYAWQMFHLPVGGAGDDLNADVVPVSNGRARLSHLVQQKEATHCQSGLVQHRAATCKQQPPSSGPSGTQMIYYCIMKIQTAACG